jgi:hypothetical protein
MMPRSGVPVEVFWDHNCSDSIIGIVKAMRLDHLIVLWRILAGPTEFGYQNSKIISPGANSDNALKEITSDHHC